MLTVLPADGARVSACGLGAASIIPLSGAIHLLLGVALLGFFAFYLVRVSHDDGTEEHDLIGPAARLGVLPLAQRRPVVVAMFVGAALVILASRSAPATRRVRFEPQPSKPAVQRPNRVRFATTAVETVSTRVGPPAHLADRRSDPGRLPRSCTTPGSRGRRRPPPGGGWPSTASGDPGPRPSCVVAWGRGRGPGRPDRGAAAGGGPPAPGGDPGASRTDRPRPLRAPPRPLGAPARAGGAVHRGARAAAVPVRCAAYRQSLDAQAPDAPRTDREFSETSRRTPRRVMSTHRLVVADATLRGRPGRWRIGIDDGRIAAVTQEALAGREEVDAAGGLVTRRPGGTSPSGPASSARAGSWRSAPPSRRPP